MTVASAIAVSGLLGIAAPAQAATVCVTAPNGAQVCGDNGAGGGTGTGGSSTGNGGAGQKGSIPPPPPRPTPVAPAPKVAKAVVKITNVTSSGFTVSWNKPAIVGTRGSYAVFVSQKLPNPKGGVLVSRGEYSPLTNSVKFTRLKANATYIVTVVASSTSAGKTVMANTITTFTTKR